MKNKIFTLFFALVASIGTMSAESGTCGKNLTWSFNTNGVLTISGTGYMYNYSSGVIPWSSCSSSIKSVIINEGVKSIGDWAFHRCSGLTSIEIPNNITSIGDYAFYNCISLTSAKIGDGVKSIGINAFSDCFSLISVTIGNSVTSIGDDTFGYCSKLTTVAIPNSVTSLGIRAFYRCESLISIEIPNSVTSIGDLAFYGCKGLTSVTIPNSVTSIGCDAFYGCKGLTAPVYNAHVFAFMPRSYSGAYIIPNGIKSIAGSAFSFCERLTSIKIPNSVTTINKEAFYYCTGLTSITCEAVNPPTYGAGAFIDVDESIPFYVLTGSISAYKTAIGWKSFTNILPLTAEQTEVTGPAIEPDVTSAEIAWPVVTGAASYDIVIKNANGNVICTLTFNEQGQLTNIAYNAPARDSESKQTQSAGFAFTVTGLEPGTQYSYSIVAKNASGATLSTETGTFNTKSLEALENTASHNKVSRKFLRNGQLYILRGDMIYNASGMRVE